MSAQVQQGNPKLRAMPEGVARSACKLAIGSDPKAMKRYYDYTEDYRHTVEIYTGAFRGYRRGERNEQ